MKLFNKLFQGDRVIWMIVALLSLVSLLAVYSATGTYANTNVRFDGSNTKVLLSHAGRLFLGLAVMYVVYLFKYTYYSKIFQVAFVVSIPLLAYTLFKGVDLNNAQRVVHIMGISFQSSDFAKVALIGYLARELTLRQNEIKDFKHAFIPLMLPVLIIVGLIFPENFSTAAILFAACMVLLFVGRINMKHLMAFFGIALVIMSFYILIKLNDKDENDRVDTWFSRIESYINPQEGSETDDDYQMIMSKTAIAKGGVFGNAPGRSTQRNFLPHPYSDFIFAIIVEEYGLIGAAFVVLLYLILLYRSIAIMVAIPQSFGGFVSFGLAFMLVMQAMVNMGVAVGLLPVTGQPLPFVSMGGTSLMFTGCAFGVILSVSREVNKIKERKNDVETA